MNKELLEVLKQVYRCEIKNLKEDEVDEDFLAGVGFGMRFMMKIVSDCVDNDFELVRRVYHD